MASTLEEIREMKHGILEDMRNFITYTPCRENDILAFMEKYKKAEIEERPEILEDMRNCMDGKKYPNPYLDSYHYAEKDIHNCEKILDTYIDDLSKTDLLPEKIPECIDSTIARLNKLNASCDMYLIDTWRRERLLSLIDSAASAAGMGEEMCSNLKHSLG